MKFKPGDRVVCFSKNPNDPLVIGNTYTILDYADLSIPRLVRVAEYKLHGYFESRFEHLQPSPTVTTTTTLNVVPGTPTGVKHDQGKPDMSLLSNIALIKIAEVMTYGKGKYTAHNWRGGFVWSRPLAAAVRHLFAYIGGEDKDPETGLSHLAHCACCLMFLLEFETTHKELDDRFKDPKKTDVAA